MAITISSSSIQSIDALYPIAGVDNDSQGFRDNFNVIKTQMGNAATDLSTLDTTTAKLNAANDFNGNNILDANLLANTEEVNSIGTISAGQNIDWSDGHYQTLTVGDDITLSLTGWGTSGRLSKMRVEVSTSDVTKVITWNAIAGSIIKGPGFPASFVVSNTAKRAIVDFWTTNAGGIVFADYIGEFGA
jgi:hypothetical protein|tara:strand:- start:919 stop:1485 length:567 start_codon:yes stop_codon:yes gene_type:complete